MNFSIALGADWRSGGLRFVGTPLKAREFAILFVVGVVRCVCVCFWAFGVEGAKMRAERSESELLMGVHTYTHAL